MKAEMMSEHQKIFLALQRKRVLQMIGSLESTLAVLKSECQLLDGLLSGVDDIQPREAGPSQQ